MNDKTISPHEFEVSPYQPPATSMAESTEAEGLKLAGRWIRLLAYLADGLIFFIPLLALGFFVPFLANSFESGHGDLSNDLEKGIVVAIGIFFLLFFLAVMVINWVLLYKNGQTIGKRLLAIKIVRTDGSRASLLRIIFLRFLPTGLLNSIPFFGVVFTLLDPLLIFQKSRRCLHDLIADTIVIDTSKRRSIIAMIITSIVSIVLVMMMVGILAAIVIPAYTDYINKTKVTEARRLLSDATTEVDIQIAATRQFPSTLGDWIVTSGKFVASVELNSHHSYIQATMREDESPVSGKTIRMTFDAQTKKWICSAGSPNGLEDKYLPRSCRSGEED